MVGLRRLELLTLDLTLMMTLSLSGDLQINVGFEKTRTSDPRPSSDDESFFEW